MANRLIIPYRNPTPEVLQAAVAAAVDQGRTTPLKQITTPSIIATLPGVEVIGQREYAVSDTPVLPATPLPSLPGAKVVLRKATTDATVPTSVWARVLQAAALLRPSFTYLLFPIGARESGFNPTAENPKSSATGLFQLLRSSGYSTWKAFNADKSLRARLKPVTQHLPPAPAFTSEKQWRALVNKDPYFQVVPTALFYDEMVRDIIDRRLITRSRDLNIFHLPAHLINPVLEKHPFLNTDYKAAVQFLASLWWIEGGPRLRTGPWNHVSHALTDVDSLLKFNQMNK